VIGGKENARQVASGEADDEWPACSYRELELELG
jgi:hypothetical protein